MTVSETTATYEHDLREGWKCFHCGEKFFTPANAAVHFGAVPTAEPGCLLKVQRGEERSLLYALRSAEQERDEALVRLKARQLGLDKELEDETVERFRATRGILFPASAATDASTNGDGKP